MLVYRATSLLTGKVYIGLTKRTLNKRIQDYKQDIKNLKNKRYFINALRRYGLSNFKWDVLCECNTVDELTKAEAYFIEFYQSHKKKFGYNTLLGIANIKDNADFSTIKMDYIAGMSYEEMAKKYGCKRGTIVNRVALISTPEERKVLSKMRLSQAYIRNGRTASIEKINKVLTLHDSGVVQTKIAEILEISRTSVRRILDGRGSRYKDHILSLSDLDDKTTRNEEEVKAYFHSCLQLYNERRM